MSTKHLAAGSEQPPKEQGKLRLYSMEYCPYAHRARLILRAKAVPHDIVNINLLNKPDWYLKVHPEGKVPALDDGSKVVVESLDICEYLEEQYPDPPLYSAEPQVREQEKALIQKINPLTSVFAKLLFSGEEKTPQDWLEEFAPHLEAFEKELESRGTPFFGGEKPNMVDYMLWPWGERAGTVPLSLGQKLPLADDQFPLLRAWRKAMRSDPVASGIYNGPEKFYKVVQFKTKNLPADYDNV